MQASESQVPATDSVFVQRLAATRRGARLARHLAACQLDAWGIPFDDPLAERAVAVVAELSANAVLHGRVPGRDFELRLLRDPGAGVVRVEVSDTADAVPAVPAAPLAPPSYDAETDADSCSAGGRGLLLVEALASRWGVHERLGPGKTVWAEVDEQPTDGS